MDPRSNTRAKQPALKCHLEGPHEQRGRLHSRQHSALKIRPVKRNPLICAINVAGDNALKYLNLPLCLLPVWRTHKQTEKRLHVKQTCLGIYPARSTWFGKRRGQTPGDCWHFKHSRQMAENREQTARGRRRSRWFDTIDGPTKQAIE